MWTRTGMCLCECAYVFLIFVWLIQQYFPIEPKQSKYFHEKWVREVVYIISKRHLTCCCLLPAILSILYQATSSTFSHINFKTRRRKKKSWRNFLQTITVKPSSALTFNWWRRKSATRRKMLKTWATCKFSQSWFISCGKSENISGVKKSCSKHWLNQSIHK